MLGGGKIELVLDKVFKDHEGKTSLLLKYYKWLYELPVVTASCEVSEKLFQYCLRKKFFVLLLVYDEDGKVFLNRNMSNSLSWGLPGGSIKKDESINQAINRIAKTIHKDMLIGNVEPVTLIENSYYYKGQVVKHYGIGFIARIRNAQSIDFKSLVGDFVAINDEEFSYIKRLASKKVVELFKNRYMDLDLKTDSCFQDEEININELQKKRYQIHNKYVKKYILTDKRKKKQEFNKIMENLIGCPNSICDVSCGEDKFIFKYAREHGIKVIVGNDISWSQVEFLDFDFDEVIFTNHNAAALPFKENVFDVVYCSNTLHHMPNKKVLINLLKSMFRVSKKIIIVEIEDPKITGGFAEFLNKYWYIGYLKDVGGAYLSENQFKVIINEVFKNVANIKFSSFENIMGKYLIAEIEKVKGEEEND